MNSKYPYFIITFPSVHYALKSEAILKQIHTNVRLVPVPREISSSCGVAAKVFESDLEIVTSNMRNNHLEFDAIYIYMTSGEKPKIVQQY